MRQFKFGSALLITLILVGCGGGGSDVPAKPKFTAQVSFGDSLSDVGSYKVGTVAALGGGQFTINGTAPTNWTELTASKFGLAAPCAALTGLDGDGTQGFSVMPPTTHAGCNGYAEGGARVTNPVGIGNKLTGGAAATLGMLTFPIVTQIQNFMTANGSSFKGDEIVFVMAGANDVFMQAALVGGGLSPASGVAAVQTAASELAADVNTQIIANGAKYVVVVNVPDIASTPYVTLIANPTIRAQTGGLLDTLVTAFNAQLIASLPDSAHVLNVDAYSASKDEVANPGKYNLTNVTGTACNLTSPSPNPLASSLVCNANNLNQNVLATDHYLFADTVHPTPYGYSLFALYVLQAMTNKGWY
jgi:phospholipase/lecithinase/hemolysin